MWWQAAALVLGGLVLLWVALVVALYLRGRKEEDPTLPRGVRVRIALLVGYLVMPIDLVPDFIPVVGYADDAIIVAIALRSITRVAGADALDRHWPGTPEGLRAVKRLAGVDA